MQGFVKFLTVVVLSAMFAVPAMAADQIRQRKQDGSGGGAQIRKAEQQRKQQRKRDGSGSGQQNGQGDRKRDGSCK